MCHCVTMLQRIIFTRFWGFSYFLKLNHYHLRWGGTVTILARSTCFSTTGLKWIYSPLLPCLLFQLTKGCTISVTIITLLESILRKETHGVGSCRSAAACLLRHETHGLPHSQPTAWHWIIPLSVNRLIGLIISQEANVQDILAASFRDPFCGLPFSWFGFSTAPRWSSNLGAWHWAMRGIGSSKIGMTYQMGLENVIQWFSFSWATSFFQERFYRLW